ncbi:hypothetical protein [Galbibacter pacificus]|uniref:Lipoprotein n=1 Tax=Galbibacter pacificus TaxID=2996052 RepID=A0ABT6FRQ9_9FLAO|nr:hypothetical protein [Galbibacter pacificus]MDG3582923.1 hypothetical protein [Galbibacter pacificus]MDG3585958.1 hypothetical protein [Galbibacter pacificus]
MKNILILLILNTVIISCKQGENKNVEEKATLSVSQTLPVTLKEDFREGIIDVDIHFPGSQLSNILNKIEPGKGSIEQQLKSLIEVLSSEEQQKINTVTASNPFVAMQVLMAPLHSIIYVKENIATAKCDGLSYHIENTVDTHSNTGTVYVVSRADTSNAITIDYDKDFFGKSQFQTKIDTETYTRQTTRETKVIAGYICKKSIYISKTNAPMSVAKLEVWTSEQMPKSLNFIHPYYIEEPNGIMKIDLFANGIDGTAMVYEFKTVSKKKLSASDLSIVEKKPVYKAKTDFQKISGKLMGIMFGAN